MVGSEKLQGNPMVAEIGEISSLTLKLKSFVMNSAKVEIRPVQAVVTNATFGDNHTLTVPLGTTGNFEMHLIAGSSTCKIPSRLDVTCKDGYRNHDSSCVQQTTLKEKLVLAVSLGTVLALCVVILLYLVRKHPERAKKIFVSFVRTRVHWI